MTLEAFVTSYGSLAVFVGTFLEGETIVILAALSAQRGYMPLWEVIIAAFFGSLLGDQFYFYLGRRHSRPFLARRPSWKSRIDRALRLLERFQTVLILAFRFLYGLRTVTPFAIGMSGIAAPTFIALNVVGAAVWAVAVSCGGYFLGQAINTYIGDMKKYQLWVFGLIAVIGCLVWGVSFLKRRRQTPPHQPPPGPGPPEPGSNPAD
jgi:membrane protein DedA with SNARE-associated domain